MDEVLVEQKSYQMPPREGFTVAEFITVADLKQSAEFYKTVFDGEIVSMGDGDAPPYIKIANTWLIINVGGGPTPDKPTVALSPPPDPNEISSFMNIRVADIQACYKLWKSRGAMFLTEPLDKYGEIRCYIRDPDSYIIEVGQSKAGGQSVTAPRDGIVVTHFITVADIDRSADFYEKVFGGRILSKGDSEGASGHIQIANTWLIINVGGGPTADKPTVTLRPPPDPNKISSFMNIRVADIQACYELWKSRGATFLTEPLGKYGEIRCYIRDPDGYIVEVGQSKPDFAYG